MKPTDAPDYINFMLFEFPSSFSAYRSTEEAYEAAKAFLREDAGVAAEARAQWLAALKDEAFRWKKALEPPLQEEFDDEEEARSVAWELYSRMFG